MRGAARAERREQFFGKVVWTLWEVTDETQQRRSTIASY